MDKKQKLNLLKERCERLNGNIQKLQETIDSNKKIIDLLQARVLRDNTFFDMFNNFADTEYKKLTVKQKRKIRELRCLIV